MPVVIFIILGFIIFVISILAFLSFVVDRNKYHDDERDSDDLSELLEYYREMTAVNSSMENSIICEYRAFGGMENEEKTIRLEYITGDEATLRIIVRRPADGKPEKMIKSISSADARRLLEIYKKNSIKTWGELSPRKNLALDAPTIQVHFITTDGEYTITSNDQPPKDKDDVWEEIMKIFAPYEEMANEKEKQ